MKDKRGKSAGDRRLVRTIVILLAVILATSCLVGATVARYATQYQTSDTARIALWFGEGAVSRELEVDLFDPQYYDVGVNPLSPSDVVTATDALGAPREITVKASDGSDVIAPGTTGSFTYDMSAYFTGSPEVPYFIYTDLGSWDVFSGPLSRLTFYVDGVKCGKEGTYREMQLQLRERKAFFGADERPKRNGTTVITISWEWPFDESDEDDAADTAYGSTRYDDEWCELATQAHFCINIKAVQANAVGRDAIW